MTLEKVSFSTMYTGKSAFDCYEATPYEKELERWEAQKNADTDDEFEMNDPNEVDLFNDHWQGIKKKQGGSSHTIST